VNGLFGPDVSAGKAKPPNPIKLDPGTAHPKMGDSCTPSALDAAAAKAKPITAGQATKIGGQYAGLKLVTCVKRGDTGSGGRAARAARDAALTSARRAAPGALRAPHDAMAALKVRKNGNPQPKQVLPIPDWCYEHVDDGWWGFRTSMCEISDVTVSIYIISNGEPVLIGTAKALEYGYAYTSDLIDRFAFQLTVTKYWGERAGNSPLAEVDGTAFCFDDCKPDGGSVRLQPGRFQNDVRNDGDSFWLSTRSEPGGIGYPTPEWEYNVTYLGAVPSEPAFVQPPQIRCDNAFSDDGDDSGDPGVGLRATLGAGCVFPGITPVMTYSKTGAYPTLAEHIDDAQNSGLPGKYPSGTVLTRLQDAVKKRENGTKACPPAWARPDEKTCDEYPFRSTYQGAAQTTGSARTFSWCDMDPAWNVPTGVTGPDGWSSCMIDKADNRNGGAALGAFYSSNRVLDKDPFWVEITP